MEPQTDATPAKPRGNINSAYSWKRAGGPVLREAHDEVQQQQTEKKRITGMRRELNRILDRLEGQRLELVLMAALTAAEIADMPDELRAHPGPR